MESLQSWDLKSQLYRQNLTEVMETACIKEGSPAGVNTLEAVPEGIVIPNAE